MAGYSARQNTYTTGDTIKAEDTNEEFDAIITAFGTSGHTHDGTAGNGGALSKLTGSNSITIGAATAGTDITMTFDGETNDGVLKWMEDEDYFEFSDAILVSSTNRLQFGDTGTYIHQSADGVLDLVSDTEIEINATTIDINGAVDISGNTTVGGDLTITGDDLTMGTNTSGHILVADGTNYNPVAVSGDVTIASNGAVTIANAAVENAMLADDAVGADELAANAVVTASIVDDNVTQAKIADDAVGADQLASSAVVTASIVDDNVTQAKIADDAVGADQLAANAVVDASVASGAAIAISKTALVAGTNISLSTNTLNVDDAFLINSGNDVTSGVITSAGYKLTVGAGSGDITTEFQQAGTTLFTVGIDDSDSEKFKIHSGTALADTSDLEITSAGVVSLASDLNVGGNLVVTGTATSSAGALISEGTATALAIALG